MVALHRGRYLRKRCKAAVVQTGVGSTLYILPPSDNDLTRGTIKCFTKHPRAPQLDKAEDPAADPFAAQAVKGGGLASLTPSERSLPAMLPASSAKPSGAVEIDTGSYRPSHLSHTRSNGIQQGHVRPPASSPALQRPGSRKAAPGSMPSRSRSSWKSCRKQTTIHVSHFPQQTAIAAISCECSLHSPCS